MFQPLQRRAAMKLATAAPFLVSSASRAFDASYVEAVQTTWRTLEIDFTNPTPLQCELARYATLGPNGHNAQPWKLRLHDTAIDIVPDWNRRTPIVDPDDHQPWASLGCAAENFVEANPAEDPVRDVSSATPWAACKTVSARAICRDVREMRLQQLTSNKGQMC